MSKAFGTGVFLALLTPWGLPGQDTTGVGGLAGVAQEEGGGPLPNAKICVTEVVRCAVSDANGGFRIPDLRPGVYAFEVTAAGRPTLRRAGVTVRAGLETRIEIVVPDLGSTRQEVTVTEPAFLPPEEIKSSGFLIQRQEISKSAGVLQDVARYVQTLPGVAIGSNDFRNDIIVRGGSPLENLFVVDNIEIPNINAFANFASAGGLVSILDAELIQDVTFLTGGYPAPYINRTSSVLQIAQREGDREQFRGRATVGFAGGGTILEGPIRQGKGSWVVSARRSFIDLFTDDVGFGGVPVLYTFNSKATYDLSPRDRIWAVSVSGADTIRLGAREGKLEDSELSNLDIRYSGWRSANGVNWQRLMGESTVGLLGVTHSEARLDSTVRDLRRAEPQPPGIPLEELLQTAPITFRDDSGEGETTIKYDLTSYLGFFKKLQAGGSYKIFRIRYDTASPTGQNTPFSLVRNMNPYFVNTRFTAYQGGAYVQSTRNLTRRLSLTWGGRFDHYEYISSRRLSPRVGLSYRLTERLSLRGAFGTYYQQPFFIFLNVFPENRGLVPFRADHGVAGVTYVVNPGLRFTIEAYAKQYKDYPVSTQFPSLSLANVGDTFVVRDVLFPLTSAGRGRVRGIEFFAEKKFSDRWFGQTNLAFMQSRQAGLDGVMRPSVYDYPVIVNAVGGYRLNSKWEISMRYAFLAGRPFTPFDLTESARQRRAIFDLARVNAERLPAYSRLDLRVDRTFVLREKPVLVFAGVQNAFNRRNVAGIDWNRRTGGHEYAEQLGLFPLIGLDWRF
ncbi:MAG: TonB-dependent receptor domain-containing protein [Bryobacteraceae bacterium]